MSKYITLITVQSKTVLNTLQKGIIYRTPLTKGTPMHYRNLSEIFNLYYSPIFCSMLDHNTNIYGVPIEDPEDLCVLELNVPESVVKFTNYYTWTDYIYFLEEDPDYAGILSGELRKQSPLDKYDVLQVIVDRINPEWLIKTYPITQDFLDKYCGNGGNDKITRDDLVLTETNLFETIDIKI